LIVTRICDTLFLLDAFNFAGYSDEKKLLCKGEQESNPMSLDKPKSTRNRYMIADFTPNEKERVLSHCQNEDTSISSFLAGVALNDVRRGNEETPVEEEVTITLKIPREQSAKLQMFARRQNKTTDQFCQDVLLPTLEKGKTSFNSKTESLRYYLSTEEHRLLKQYLKGKNLSARTYISFLALKALNQDKK
jgi:hypothetical protein